ncbi:unnamed protein product [Didymodactylos carnosus]|uniref:Tubulin-specific chaperone A n=2 Tax=Philodinidae TaxID=44580 RepID=A0A814P4V4_9BILA|nr:unnamed protein product [Didymodactylos carnosus]CAF3866375.1 unnamed protein product [Didymodactylos carnosus]
MLVDSRNNQADDLTIQTELNDHRRCIQELREIFFKVKQYQQDPEKYKTELAELHTRGMLLCNKLRSLNRSGRQRIHQAREITAEHRNRLDEQTLEQQNLLYELSHVNKEIARCEEFKSKDQQLELVSVEDFYAQAPPELTNKDVIGNDQHRLHLFQLDWELMQRERLNEECKTFQNEIGDLKKQIMRRRKRLRSLRPKLKDVVASTRPVRRYIDSTFDDVATTSTVNNPLISKLPDPLYVLYSLTFAYQQCDGRHVTCEIEQNNHISTVDTIELMRAHPVRVKITLTLSVDHIAEMMFIFYPLLNIVTVQSKLSGLKASQNKMLTSSLLHNLLDDIDVGDTSPNPVNDFLFREQGKTSHTFNDETGLPYRWVQQICKCQIIPLERQELICDCSDIMKRLTQRFRSRIVLDRTLTSLERLEMPLLGEQEAILARQKLNCVLRSWHEMKYDDIQKLEHVKPFIEEGVINQSTIYYGCKLQNDQSWLIATICISPNYPNIKPLIVIKIMWKSEQTRLNDENIKIMERSLLIDLSSNTATSTTDPQQQHLGLLAFQIWRLASAFDLYLESECYALQSEEFSKNKPFLTSYTGRRRRSFQSNLSVSINERSSTNAHQSSANTASSEDTSTEPAISIFSVDYKKHEDLKQMLDSNKDNLKLEAMRRIIGMIAKGKDAADLFPAVVKNVVSKNMEVKKLVYVYLMRYAEEQQDLALLSIATFQRGLKDPNQLIRASALRVLSSIRVPTIVSIMMLAIRDAVSDMSPYVRKTAANAIAKLYALDMDLKEELVTIIGKLLADKTILVNGSAVQAFEHVCPERIDLIHQNYRRLCNLLVDIDEWGQVVVVNMLTRYARSQFMEPNLTYEDERKDFYGDDKEKQRQHSTVDDEDERKIYIMDSDHRLLLRCTKPLLQSRNSAVVMAVAQLYYHVAPKTEVQIVAKALIRLLRHYREIQTIVLKSIASMADKHKQIFEPYLKSFYVHSNDSGQVKRYKLEILTVLANETNISTILREFQTYVLSADKEFGAQTIHAIGRCASTIKEVTEACLNGLITFNFAIAETIVAESVVVVKKLLQINPSQYSEIIKHIVRMVDKVVVPTARASILWLIGEYSDRISKLAPDVLRKMVKNFTNEETIVKQQILNLAAKLYVVNPQQTQLLVQYVFNLAKYDKNYDTRDKARLLRALLIQSEKCPNLSRYAKKILLVSKPAPTLESLMRDNDQYALGTLSYVIGQKANGYKDLPDFPLEPPDPTVRNVEVILPEKTTPTFGQKGKGRTPKGTSATGGKTSSAAKGFYSEDESTEGPDPSDEESTTSTSEESLSESGDENEEEQNTDDDDNDDESETRQQTLKTVTNVSDYEQLDPSRQQQQKSGLNKNPTRAESSESGSESSDEELDDDESEDDSSASSEIEEEPQQAKTSKKPSNVPLLKGSSEKVSQASSDQKTQSKADNQAINEYVPPKETSLFDLDLETFLGSGPVNATASTTSKTVTQSKITDDLNILESLSSAPSVPAYTRQFELLNRMTGSGLQIQYRYPRTKFNRGPNMVNIELLFTNTTQKDIQHILFLKARPGVQISEFAEIDVLSSGATLVSTMGIDFNDKTQSAQFDITVDGKQISLSIPCQVGEMIEQRFLNEQEFLQELTRLKGMSEISETLKLSVDTLEKLNFSTIQNKIIQCANVIPVPVSSHSAIYRCWKEYLSYKKECENERKKVEKMKSDERDQYDIKKQEEVLKETEGMISHTKSGFIKSWKEFQNLYTSVANDENIKQSKEYQDAEKVYDEIVKAQEDDK